MSLRPTTWRQLGTDRRAVTALEYALLASLIVAIILLGFGELAFNLQTKFSGIGASVTAGL
jgi:Flp pilus assembly pilin Flp